MMLPPSPFMISAAPLTAETAPAADDWYPEAAGVDHYDSVATVTAPDEAAALVRHDTAAVDLIAEIFIGADKLNAPRFVLDVERFMLELDEPPLFLRRA